MVSREGGGWAGVAESELEVKCGFFFYLFGSWGAKVRVRVTKIPIIYIITNRHIYLRLKQSRSSFMLLRRYLRTFPGRTPYSSLQSVTYMGPPMYHQTGFLSPETSSPGHHLSPSTALVSKTTTIVSRSWSRTCRDLSSSTSRWPRCSSAVCAFSQCLAPLAVPQRTSASSPAACIGSSLLTVNVVFRFYGLSRLEVLPNGNSSSDFGYLLPSDIFSTW